MATLIELQGFRERLREARYSGALRIRDSNGEELTYRSDSELARAIAAIETEIAGQSRPASTILFRTSKGV